MAAQIGVYGLGVMGKNLALNLADKGFPVAISNRSPDLIDALLAERHRDIQGHRSPRAFAASLERPRRILLMVKAGAATDATIASLAPFLDPGDILVDGGNALFSDTERRARELSPKGIRFVGMGVSGGEQGARHGPSLMPGGPREAYEALAPMLTKIAAQVDDGPCVAYMGPGGAGHYVKMVHNGIEYADMQLIAEAYDVLRRVGGLSNRDLAALFDEWNRGELESFLIDITARILRRPDTETGGELIDRVLDTAATKGTGGWTVQDAAALGAPIPTIAAALDARLISAAKTERVAAAPLLPGPRPSASPDGRLVQAVQLRPGHGPPGRRLARARVPPRSLGDRPHLERRLHHPRPSAGQDSGGDAAQPLIAEPVARSVVQGRTRVETGRLAARDGVGRRTRPAAARHGRGARLLRRDPNRATPGQPDPGPAGLLRRAHVSADRPQGRRAHRLGRGSRRLTRARLRGRLLKKFQMQGRREEETGAYWVVREDFRRPRTQQMDFFSSLLGFFGRRLIRTRYQPSKIGVFAWSMRSSLGLLVLAGHLLRGFLFLLLLPLHFLTALLKRGFRVSPHASSPL